MYRIEEQPRQLRAARTAPISSQTRKSVIGASEPGACNKSPSAQIHDLLAEFEIEAIPRSEDTLAPVFDVGLYEFKGIYHAIGNGRSTVGKPLSCIHKLGN